MSTEGKSPLTKLRSANAEVPVTRLGTAISRGEQQRAQTELTVLRSMLAHA